MDDEPLIFEETYPKYEFSELVRLSLLFADWIGRLRRSGRDQAGCEPAPDEAPGIPAAAQDALATSRSLALEDDGDSGPLHAPAGRAPA